MNQYQEKEKYLSFMKLLMKLKPQNKLKNSDFEINLTEDSKLRSKSILPTQKN